MILANPFSFANLLGGLVSHWRILLAAGLTGLLWIQTGRLENAQEATAKAKRQTQELVQKLEGAEQASALKGSKTGLEAVTVYAEKEAADAPIMERVVERVRNVCLRPTENHRLPVSQGAGAADEAPSRAQDDEDRAFAKAIADDLQACNSELNKLRELQGWVRANGG